MAGWTNLGKRMILGHAFNQSAGGVFTVPTGLRAVFVTNAVAPTILTTTLSGLTEISGDAGYTSGGVTITLASGTWDSDDTAADGNVGTWVLANVAIVSAGVGWATPPRYMILSSTFSSAGVFTATVANRLVYAWWDLGALAAIGAGQTLTVNGAELRTTE